MKTKPSLGILLLDTVFPRIPGDVGNVQSYEYPVIIKTVTGATVQRVVYEADASLLADFIQVARELEAQGAIAITSSCGFLSVFQEALARSVQIPVFLSSLLQVPLVYAMTQKPVGIVTAHSERLTEEVLDKAGISAQIPYVVGGLQNSPAFSNPILKDGTNLQRDAIEKDVLDIATSLINANPKIGAFVFECHNLAPYGQAVQGATGLPVFDIIDFANWVYSAINKCSYPMSKQASTP
jgi:Asp/Glu/hydantoin racemase